MKTNQKNLEFPVQAAYFVGSLALVNNKEEILLVKERNNYDIWTVPGGEVDYEDKEQFIDAAIRETEEEVGISVEKNNIELLDVRISYAEGDNPYKENEIFIPVITYITKFPEKQKIELRRSEDEIEKKYDVEEYIWIKPDEIIEKNIKTHKNFIKTIPKIKEWIKSVN
ncbi:NUDIX domain-containing protein [Patescibacteria group bacterium]|nr:NUDIX domain-containing protein [Patescibacteria group bacterium]